MPKQTLTLIGKIKNTNDQPISNLRIEAWDMDLLVNDFVGEATTDKSGRFKITFTQKRFREFFLDAKPDIYFKIYSNDKLVHSTEKSVLWNIEDDKNDLEIIIDMKAEDDNTKTEDGDTTFTGTVKHSNGNSITNIKVVLSEQLLRDKKTISTTSTNANGSFSFPANAYKEKEAVVIEAVGEKDEVLASAGPLYLPAKKTNYELTVSDAKYKGEAEYSKQAPVLKKYFEQLQNNKEQKPLSVQDVYFVANNTGTEPRDTFRWLRANEMEAKTKIPAEVFYGLYSQGLPTDPAALGAISGDEIEKALNDAAKASKVSDSVAAKAKQMVAEWNNHIVSEALDEVPNKMNASLGGLLSVVLPDKDIQKQFLSSYLSYDGSLKDFWKTTDTITGVDGSAVKIQNVLKLSSLTGNHPAMLEELANKKYSSQNIFHDLAAMNKEEWAGLINEVAQKTGRSAVPDFIEGKNEEKRVSMYATVIADKLEQSFPTHSFFGKLSGQPGDISAFAKSKIDLTTFFKNNPAFDIKKSDTIAIAAKGSSFVFEGITDKNVLVAELQSVQRLMSYTSSFHTLSFMKNEGLDSAYNIVSIPQNQFVADYSAALGSVQTALAMHKAAERNYMQAMSMWAATNQNLSFKTTATPNPVSEPTLRTMFGTLDSCECEHCTSVFSPAAYYTDILNFLHKRSPDVYNELIRRRPDLIKIELTCTNTNTPLPYVDLVNELLENRVLKINGLAVPPAYQTTWQAAELIANPENISYAAYDKLKDAVYPGALPFNLPVEETRVYLKHLGPERHQLMNVFYPGTTTEAFNDFILCMERMGFNKQEARILSGETTGFDSNTDTGLWNFYGFDKSTGYKPLPDPADSSKQISGGNWDTKLTERVDVFLQQTGLLYKEMLSLLLCSTINPITAQDAAGNDLYAITIVATNGDNDTCELDKLKLNGITNNHLTQIHRFIRLWKKTGWSIFEVDKVCMALGVTFLKTAALNKTDLVKAAQAKFIAESFNLSIESTLALWSDIGIAAYRDYFKDNYPPVISLYEKLFINKAVINPVDTAFADPSALAGNLDTHSATIIAALQLSAEDYSLLKTNLGITTLSLSNVSLLYRHALLAKKMHLSIVDFFTLKSILGVSPFGSPSATFDFIEKYNTVITSGFSITQINYLLNHTYNVESGVAPSDEVISVFLSELRNALRSLGSGATTEEQQNIITQQISEKLNITATVTGMLVNIYVKGVTDATKPVANDFLTAANFLKTYTDTTDPANPKDFEPVFVRNNPAADATLAAEPDLFNDYIRLEKIASIIIKMKLSDSDAATVLKNHAAFLCTNLAVLPVVAAAGSFSQFETLVNLIKARDIMPLGTPDFMSIILEAIDTPDKNSWITGLTTRTNWDRSTIEAITGDAAIVNNGGILKTTFPGDFTNGNLILKIKNCLSLIDRTGLSAAVITEVIKDDFSSTVSVAIKNTAKGKYNEAQWNKLARPLRNQLREKQRQSLVSYVVAHSDYNGTTNFERWNNSDELYEYLLIDVEMKPITLTSRIKQAICSVQLFIDRVLLNLEHPNSNPAVSPLKLHGSQVEEWKEWRKLYRVWEANRKIFLYPENWIEPELRDDKSPFFKELEAGLKQNELTTANVEDAFHTYLDKLDEVARLEVVGLYHQVERELTDEDNIDILHVFARTPIDPHHYYHRTLENGEWTSWFKMEIDVDGNHIVPVIFNRKLCLFWLFFTQEAEDNNKQLSQPVPATKKHWKIQIAWSEFRKNKWTAKRLSKEAIKGLSLATEHNSYIEYYKTKFSLHTATQSENEKAPRGFADDRLFLNIYYSSTGPETGVESSYIFSSFVFDNTNTDPYLLNGGPTVGALTYDFGHANIGNQMVEKHLEGSILKLQDIKLPILESSHNGPYKLVCSSNGFFSFDKHFFFQDKSNTFFVQHTERLIPEITKPDYSFGDWEHDFIRLWGDHNIFELEPEVPVFNPDDFAPDPAPDDFFGTRYEPVKLEKLTENGGLPTFEFIDPTVNSGGNLGNRGFGGTPQFVMQPMHLSAPKAASLAKSKTTSKATVRKKTSLISTGQYIISKFINEHEFTFSTFYHNHIKTFKKELYKKGVQGLLKREVETQPDSIKFNDSYAPTILVSQPYPKNDIDFSYGSAYSQYNWELFFHVPMLVACRLKDDQRFEESRKWFHFIFDPTKSEGGDKERFWQFKPFYEAAGTTIQTLTELLDYSSEMNRQIDKWMKNPFKPHVIARMRTSAYMKNVVLKYLDNLISWADNLFKRDTIEAINEATNLYIMAANILGPRPQEIPPRAAHDDYNFDDIKGLLDNFSNTLVNIETMLAVSSDSSGAVSANGSSALGKMSYFCVPRNEFLMKYWDTVADRLFKIRNSMNIQGVVRTLPLFEPPIDPAMLVRAAAAGMDLNSILSDMNATLPNYRFSFMLQKAIEFSNEVKGLGGALLQALEKRDAESFALLRSTHEQKVLNAVLAIKEKQVDDAKIQIESIQKTKEITQLKHDYYSSRPFMNSLEKQQLDSIQVGMLFSVIQGELNTIGGVLSAIPNLKAGAPTSIGVTWGGDNLGAMMNAISTYLGIFAAINNAQGSMAGTLGSYTRRMDDWRFQTDSSVKELQQMDIQVLSSEIKLAIAEKDLQNQQLQIENSMEADDFMRSKFTNQELYDWMIGQLATVYFQSYQLAYDLAKKAEQCYQYELGEFDNTSFIQFGYWDSLKKGLLSAEKLQYNLRRMESSYYESNNRELEMTKHISLLMLNPQSIIDIRNDGTTTFIIPEEIYDLDYPGHYFRRIKSVSVSIPCIAGPYTTVNATLRLLKHTTRLNTTGGTYQSGDYSADNRFRHITAATHSIATSNAQNDSGVFELNFRDERYLPFEGCGAFGEWLLELNTEKELRMFDYNSISDVIITIRYTAREDAGGFKNSVTTYLKNLISNTIAPTNTANGLMLNRMFSLKHEYGTEWHKLFFPPAGGASVMSFKIQKEQFPYFVQKKTVAFTKLHVYGFFDTTDDYTVNIKSNNGAVVAFALTAGNNYQVQNTVALPANFGLGNFELTIKKTTPAGEVDAAESELRDIIIVTDYNVTP